MTLIKEKRWDCIANKVERKWNDDVFEDKKDKVCWAYYIADDYGPGTGFIWANKCVGDPEKDDYYCKFAEECHAELGTGDGDVWSDNVKDHDTSAEMFESCDAIIYSSYYRNLVDEVEGEDEARKQGRARALSVLRNTRAWQNGRVFDLTKSGSSNWHELRIVHYGEKFWLYAIATLLKYTGSTLRNLKNTSILIFSHPPPLPLYHRSCA